MQIVKSYNQAGTITSRQQIRLFHIGRPQILKWRKTRHGQKFQLDETDQWIIKNVKSDKIVAVDFAGWYFELFGLKTVCLESSEIAKAYWPQCYIEPDIITWRPTYISSSDPVVFRNPWFLRYATLDQFVTFLETWAQSLTILNFEPIMIQHNHLKFKLIDLVAPKVKCKINEINENLWAITPCTNSK